jgi:hypothetical protein
MKSCKPPKRDRRREKATPENLCVLRVSAVSANCQWTPVATILPHTDRTRSASMRLASLQPVGTNGERESDTNNRTNPVSSQRTVIPSTVSIAAPASTPNTPLSPQLMRHDFHPLRMPALTRCACGQAATETHSPANRRDATDAEKKQLPRTSASFASLRFPRTANGCQPRRFCHILIERAPPRCAWLRFNQSAQTERVRA